METSVVNKHMRPAAPSRAHTPHRPAQPAPNSARPRRRPRYLQLGVRVTVSAGFRIGWQHPVRASSVVPLPQLGQNPFPQSPASGWSAWAQITAGEPLDLVLDQAVLNMYALVSMNWWVELGTGAAGAEVPIVTMPGRTAISGSGATPFIGETRRLPPFLLPANTPLSVRVRCTSAVAGDFAAGIFVHAHDPAADGFVDEWDPDTYAAGNTGSVQTVTPAVPTWTAVFSGGAANTYGAWVTMIAAATTRLRVVAVALERAVFGRHVHLQVGTGPAGAEVAHSIASNPVVTVFAERGELLLPLAVDVQPGERVAVRARDSGAAAGYNTALVTEPVFV